jgi:DnaJ-class molecular chaperone
VTVDALIPVDCEACGDSGLVNRNHGGQWWPTKCPACTCKGCGGQGEFEDPPFYWAGPAAEVHPCGTCGGSGRVLRQKW